MKVAIVEQILYYQCLVMHYTDMVSEPFEPPTNSAVFEMQECLSEVKHVLKCGLYGYEKVVKH
jgi:hypothetical protein